MTKLKFFVAGLVIASAAATGFAQSPVPGANPSAPQAQDCGMDRPRHDHGMEKGTGPAGKRPCGDADKKTPSKSPESVPGNKGHDHGKFHKGQ